MTTREMALNIVNMMNEEQRTNFVSLFRVMVSDIPNEETEAAMEETGANLYFCGKSRTNVRIAPGLTYRPLHVNPLRSPHKKID